MMYVSVSVSVSVSRTTKLVQSVIETLERLDRRIKELETNVKVLSAPPPPPGGK